ncbi:MAG: preprotein translocase subunit SecG [Endomicrobium sp.]|jgi:preprotein translocase subunit SecG|nr:preprotein translocase subunit SecG [Endomicrobium sp.]
MNTVNIIFFAFKFVHYCMCIGLIAVVLLQAGKSGGMAGIFGGGSDQIFNALSGVAFVKKLTVVMACIFLFTSLMLTKLSTNIGGMMSVVKQRSNIPVSVTGESVDK